MRVLRGGRYLAHSNWDHFHVRGAVLSTPEGHELPAGDLAWLSLLVRRARAFSGLLPKRDAPLTGCRSLGRLHGDGAVLPQSLDTDSRDALALSLSQAPSLESAGNATRKAGNRTQLPALRTPAIERSTDGKRGKPEGAFLSLTLPVRPQETRKHPRTTPRKTKRAAAMAVQS